MTIKTKHNAYTFSFLESISREKDDPYQNEHFSQVMAELRNLERWMRDNNIENGWTLTEKLAFLRNAEANIRTGTAIRRTQIAWLALVLGSVAALSGMLITLYR